MNVHTIRRLVSGMGRDAGDSHLISTLLIELLTSNSNFELRVHPYGFVHIVLWKGKSEESLRVHIWVDGAEVRDLPTRVHRHAWNLTSHVLVGELLNEFYSVESKATGKFRLFSVAYKDQSSIRLPTDTRVDCSLVDSQSYKAGEFYNVQVDEYHRTVVAKNSFTATLFVTQPQTSQPLVVGLFGEEEEHTFERSNLDPNYSRVVIDRLVERLKSAHEPHP